jgi:hypothetical protein
MEVNEGNINEAIIYLGKIKDILWPNISNAKYKVYEEKIINIMALLNELRKLKSLESENKKLKKENETYKGIIKEIENDFGNGILQNENGFGVKLEHLIEIKKQKYLGGEE